MLSRSWKNIDEVLDTFAQKKGEPGNLHETLQYIVQTAKKLSDADVCVIFAINPITGQFISPPIIEGDLLSEDNALIYELPKEGPTQRILKGDGLLVEDVESTLDYHSKFNHAEDIRSFVALTLYKRQDQNPLGVLYLHYRQPQLFSPEDHNLFQLFTDQAAFLLQETWLLLRYQEVARIGQDINHDFATADILFQKLQKSLPNIVNTQHALLLAVYQPSTRKMELHMEEEGRLLFYDHIQGNACNYVMETQQPVFIGCLSLEAKDLPFQIARIEGVEPKEALIFVPLVLREKSLGVLSIQHPQPHIYTQEDLSILQLLANHIALALNNISQYETLRSLHETGQLLTQQLDSGDILQVTVDKIHEATQADLVILYAYEPTHHNSVYPPSFAGELLNASTYHFLHSNQPGDMMDLLFPKTQPIFLAESQDFFCQLEASTVQARQCAFQRDEGIHSTALLPLHVGDELIGVLFVHFRQQQSFDSLQKLFIEGLAHYASIAIRNAHTFDTLAQRRVRDLATLQNIDHELNRVLDLTRVLTRLLELASERVPAEGASIWLLKPQTKILELTASIHRHSEGRRTGRNPLQETQGITRWVAEHKQSARVANVHRDAPWCDLYMQMMPETLSELDVPILDEEEVIGVLNFESIREGAFRQEDEDFLQTLAGQAVLAIRNAQAYEREKRLAEEGQVLNEISKEIISQIEDHSHVFDLILEKALQLTDSKTGVLMLYDAEQNDLWMAAEHGAFEEMKGKRHSLHQGVVGYVARTRELLNVDLTQAPWNDVYLNYIPGARYELAVPMLAGPELRGVLNIESSSPYNFTDRDERLLKGLADLAVVALQHAELYAKAESEARRFSFLYKAAATLSEISEIEQLEHAYDIILKLAASYKQNRVILRRYDSSSRQLILTRQDQHTALVEQLALDDGVSGLVAREQQTISFNDIHHLPPPIHKVKIDDKTTRSLVVVPIRFKERFYGTLGLSHQKVGYFKETDIKFFEGLAHQLGGTIYRLESEKRAQELEKLSAIGHFAFELTHRWDNDLGLVKSHVNNINAELTEMGEHNPIITKELDNIVQGVRNVLSWSEDLKLVASSGKAIDKFEITSIKTLFAELLKQMHSFCPPTIEVEISFADDLAQVEIIPRLIADCLWNLIKNALDAMHQGGKLLLAAENSEAFVAIYITDTGIGIPEDMQDKIFELFVSTKGSSGFGLWSARTNVLKNHGTLEVKSTVGKGTTFTLLLPKAEHSPS
jgi:GAF domain-containing protein